VVIKCSYTYPLLIEITSSLVYSPAAITDFVDILLHLPADPPSIYVDVEGINLSRAGSISIIALLVCPNDHVYLIDVHTLGEAAFLTPGKNGKTLMNILESSTIPKVFFDVRNDSDALYTHFNIALQGVQDVQLMENAARPGDISGKKFINSLAKCIEMDARITPPEKRIWKIVKDKGGRLFDPDKRGSYEVFNTRPIMEDIRLYCVQDVQFLPDLRELYWGRLKPEWKGKVVDETRTRVLSSQLAMYQPHGSDRALSPWQNLQPAATLGKFWNQDLNFEDDYDWFYEDYDDAEDYDYGDDNDFEDWTRCPWQGPPS
jgi:exonuclease 3'-5' domain-containing protein 1